MKAKPQSSEYKVFSQVCYYQLSLSYFAENFRLFSYPATMNRKATGRAAFSQEDLHSHLAEM